MYPPTNNQLFQQLFSQFLLHWLKKAHDISSRAFEDDFKLLLYSWCLRGWNWQILSPKQDKDSRQVSFLWVTNQLSIATLRDLNDEGRRGTSRWGVHLPHSAHGALWHLWWMIWLFPENWLIIRWCFYTFLLFLNLSCSRVGLMCSISCCIWWHASLRGYGEPALQHR